MKAVVKKRNAVLRHALQIDGSDMMVWLATIRGSEQARIQASSEAWIRCYSFTNSYA